MKKYIESLNEDELWINHAFTIKELKKRKLIRTRNTAGERGEQLAIKTYNSTPNESNLQAAPEGTQNVDALSRKGERYAIKTVTLPRTLTGVFYGLNPPETKEEENKKFEYLIVVMIDDSFELIKILECNWETFLKHKKWHKTMRAWNINVTRKLEGECRIIHKNIEK
ncbi:hypothetical protein HOD29_07185 [archaeon]|nr:hypothetical protein [archaeon]